MYEKVPKESGFNEKRVYNKENNTSNVQNKKQNFPKRITNYSKYLKKIL